MVGVLEINVLERGVNAAADTLSAGEPVLLCGPGDGDRLPVLEWPGRGEAKPEGVEEAKAFDHKRGEAFGLPSMLIKLPWPPLPVKLGKGLAIGETVFSIEPYVILVGVVGTEGVHGRVRVVLLPLRSIAGRGRERGEAGNGDGLGEDAIAKERPVGRTSSRCR